MNQRTRRRIWRSLEVVAGTFFGTLLAGAVLVILACILLS